MNQMQLNTHGLLESLESNICRANALATAVRLNLELTSASLYTQECIHNLDTLRQILSDAEKFHDELVQQLKDFPGE